MSLPLGSTFWELASLRRHTHIPRSSLRLGYARRYRRVSRFRDVPDRGRKPLRLVRSG